MIDPEINNFIREAAIAAARRSQEVDLGEIWGRLLAVDPETILNALDNTEYPYGAIPILGQPGGAYTAKAEPLSVIGIDGSQIYPEMDQPVLWGYIQALAYRQGVPPKFLSDFIDLGTAKADGGLKETGFTRNNPAESINYWRTLLEMRLAVSVVDACVGDVILMDYPLLPWINPEIGNPARRVSDYVELVKLLKGSLLAGVVSSPNSRLLINLIDFSEKLNNLTSKLPDINDGILMAFGLPAEQRSAIFKYAGLCNEICKKQGVEFYFFFIHLNNGNVVRVEIPDWVITDSTAIEKLHASILADSMNLGYPYTLAAAHKNVCIPLDVASILQSFATTTYLQEGGKYVVRAKQLLKT